jgi:hypothetical protein
MKKAKFLVSVALVTLTSGLNQVSCAAQEETPPDKKLGLGRAITIALDDEGGVKVIQSLKEVAEIEEAKKYDPLFSFKGKSVYFTSKKVFDLKKSSARNGKIGLSAFDIGLTLGVESSYSHSIEEKHTDIYLLTTYNVPTKIYSIDRSKIQLSASFLGSLNSALSEQSEDVQYIQDHLQEAQYIQDHLQEAQYIQDHLQEAQYIQDHPKEAQYIQDHPKEAQYIKELMETQYIKLMETLGIYGFYVATEVVVGGRLYFEGRSKASDDTNAEKTLRSFNAEIKAGYLGNSGAIGGGISHEHEKNISLSMESQLNAIKVIGGEPGDLSKWVGSVKEGNSQVVKRTNFISVLSLLENNKGNEELKKKVTKLLHGILGCSDSIGNITYTSMLNKLVTMHAHEKTDIISRELEAIITIKKDGDQKRKLQEMQSEIKKLAEEMEDRRQEAIEAHKTWLLGPKNKQKNYIAQEKFREAEKNLKKKEMEYMEYVHKGKKTS